MVDVEVKASVDVAKLGTRILSCSNVEEVEILKRGVLYVI